MSIVFEQPWPLLITAGIVLLLLVIFRAVFPKKRHWWQWLIPAIFVAAAFGLDLLVETDVEKIEAVISTAVMAVQDENPAAIEALIADNYRDSFHKTKDAIMRHCKVRLREPIIERNIERIQAIRLYNRPGEAPTAHAVFTVRMLFEKSSYVYETFKHQLHVKAVLDLQKQPDGRWLITRVEVLELDFHPVSWKNIAQLRW